ncbi:hypothetical protein FACS1894180_5900 [Bacteroidia bacterium]|nr:hypothetical protein FACS1894180_5900 [Bacteroidia bacterium]
MKKAVIILGAIALLSCNHAAKNNQTQENATDSIGDVETQNVHNYLKGQTWQIDQLLCLDEKQKNYTFSGTSQQHLYGDFIYFPDSVNFVSYYLADCGNDCFTTVFGKYHLLSATGIAISVDSVTYEGDCSRPTEYRAKRTIVFDITQNDSINTIQLTLKSQ